MQISMALYACRTFLQSKASADPLGSACDDATVDDAVDKYQSEMGITDADAAAVHKLQGAAKVHRLAAAIKTQQFMQRYRNDLATRDGRLRELAKHW